MVIASMSRNKSDFRKPWFSFRSPRFEIMSRLLGDCDSDNFRLDTDDVDLIHEYKTLRNIANNIAHRLDYIYKSVIFNKNQTKLL